jgi:phosphohistidine phosphatase
MHRLLLVRHAQTLSTQSNSTDKDRMLSHHGIADATQLGVFLKKCEINVNLIFSSPALRAQQTADLIVKQLLQPTEKIILDEIYSGTSYEILEMIKNTDEGHATVLLTGHMPVIAELHNLLADKKIESMAPCEMIALEIQTPWQSLSKASVNKRLSFIPS